MRYETATSFDELVRTLTEHHGTPWGDDALTVRLGRVFYSAEILHDDWSGMDEVMEAYGKLIEVRRGTVYPQRPDEMDGNAEIVGFGRSYDRYWWQPPEWGPKRGTDEFIDFRSSMIELVEDGFYIINVEAGLEVDEKGEVIALESSSLGMIERSYLDGWMSDVVGELMYSMDKYTRQTVLCDPYTGVITEESNMEALQ